MIGNSPCYECPDRHVLCHSTCEKYIKYSEERRELNRERQSRLWSENVKTCRYGKNGYNRGSRIH